MKCVNCGDNHPASSKRCKKRKAMQETKSNRANSHRENTRTAKTRCKKTNCADSHRLSQHRQGQGKYKQRHHHSQAGIHNSSKNTSGNIQAQTSSCGDCPENTGGSATGSHHINPLSEKETAESGTPETRAERKGDKRKGGTGKESEGKEREETIIRTEKERERLERAERD